MPVPFSAGVDHPGQHALSAQGLDDFIGASGVVAEKEDAGDAVNLREHRQNGRYLIPPHDGDSQVVVILGPETFHQGNLRGGASPASEVLQDHAMFPQVRQAAPARKQRDVLPRLFQPRRVEAADHAPTHYQDSHSRLLAKPLGASF
jgi:hypothetical protein